VGRNGATAFHRIAGRLAADLSQIARLSGDFQARVQPSQES
jgi:hypothetical protein